MKIAILSMRCAACRCGLTATATAKVRADRRAASAERSGLQHHRFDRPNLYFDNQHPKTRWRLLALISERGQERIIYCATRTP
ncbi:MAG: hypothetical protein ACLVJ6_04285 [Merdibacter sp.]